MKCTICAHGETTEGHVTQTLQRGGFTVIVKNVPARICDNCGKQYIDEALLKLAEQSVQAGVERDVRQYAA
ncbi:MAG: type II toxin-antitoxin system MqsA family antitoxin [Myxococcales bacterium]|nr:MAG: type II toxin-antitoxin system MqsA family antitoxin [Myxococcales bacterium]